MPLLALGSTAGAAIHARSDPGAEACPNETELVRRVEAIRGRSADGSDYHVRFAREGERLTATIRSADGSSARVLKADDRSCESLAQATAVALSLLVDAQPAPPAAPVPTAPLPAEPEPSSAESTTHARHVATTIALGGAALAGVVRPVAPVFQGELGVAVAAFRASLGALWMVPQTLPLPPGSVHESLAAGTTRLCLAPYRQGASRFDLCAGAYLGVRTAEGRGFSVTTRSRTPWLAFPLEASFTLLPSPLGVELSAAVLPSVPARRYVVEGVGTAYDPWPVGFVLALRGIAVWPW